MKLYSLSFFTHSDSLHTHSLTLHTQKTGLPPELDDAVAAVDYYSDAFAAAPAASPHAGTWLERLGGARKGKPGEGTELSRPFTVEIGRAHV